MVPPSSQLSTIPMPFEVVANLLNLMVHFLFGSSTIATSLGIFSLNGHLSSLVNWASKFVMALLLTALGVLKLISY